MCEIYLQDATAFSRNLEQFWKRVFLALDPSLNLLENSSKIFPKSLQRTKTLQGLRSESRREIVFKVGTQSQKTLNFKKNIRGFEATSSLRSAIHLRQRGSNLTLHASNELISLPNHHSTQLQNDWRNLIDPSMYTGYNGYLICLPLPMRNTKN